MFKALEHIPPKPWPALEPEWLKWAHGQFKTKPWLGPVLVMGFGAIELSASTGAYMGIKTFGESQVNFENSRADALENYLRNRGLIWYWNAAQIGIAGGLFLIAGGGAGLTNQLDQKRLA